MRSNSLETLTGETDLGDQDLKFHLHMFKAVNKAPKMLGYVRATFTFIDETLPRLFITMVRIHLEYGNVIWYASCVQNPEGFKLEPSQFFSLTDKSRARWHSLKLLKHR